jgi:hypothetical protein
MLDKGIFQYQRFKFRVGDNDVKIRHIRHHSLGFGIVRPVKITADAVFQLPRLAHVYDLAGLIHHYVNPRLEGKVVSLFAKVVNNQAVTAFSQSQKGAPQN